MYSKRLHPKKGLCLAALLCFNIHTMPAHSLPGQETTGHPTADTTFTAPNDWAVTAIPFKLYGERQVNHVKINWQPLKGIQSYKVYRNGQLIGETQGNTYDDYDLKTDQTYTYRIDAYREHQKTASSATQETRTFTYSGETALYDNRNGRHFRTTPDKPSGFKIGKTYFSYRLHRTHKDLNGKEENGWLLSESESETGLKDSWGKPREIAFYPGVNFEGIGFHYNKKTRKVVLSAHYEDQGGYTAAKIFLAQITPKGGIEIGTMERPLGHDSRDQSLFVDEDGTAYLLSATNMNSDINIYRLDETWTKPVALANTICKGQHRETPSILKKDGTYYFFSSKASGWYPSQTMYASADRIDGKWSPLKEIGNNSTYGVQFNYVQQTTGTRETLGLWGFHWGAQYHHRDPDGTFTRISPATFNRGYASMNYFRFVEFHDQYGIIPVQNGRNLTLGATVVPSHAPGDGSAAPDCITDGSDMASSPYYKSSHYPYSLTIELPQPSRISEINLATRLVNGSETAYKYTIEGSMDGQEYQTLIDGRNSWTVGFHILPVEDRSAYKFLRLNVFQIINVHNNHPATWADGIYEFTAFGFPL